MKEREELLRVGKYNLKFNGELGNRFNGFYFYTR